MNDDPLVQFYKGNATDNRGRYLDEILAWDDDELEYTHDYIQWLFPITTVGVNPDAPPANAATIEAFCNDPLLRAALLRSLDRMLAFYGLQRTGDEIAPRADFESHRQWLTAGNHNHLRLTRIMKSLRLFGLDADARELHASLIRIAETEQLAGRRSISADTIRFWNDAVSPGG
ncbi:MAG: hypothetical protein JO322_12460 [Candidatus Eremiobacteraeota bacterium]|nr:hypothetical protein [Candidatus Eremiobacteraeota bacterium]